MKVPLLDLKGQYQTIKKEVLPVIEEVCENQGFVLGPRVESFEKNAASYLASAYAVGVASGTDALLLSLMALGVGQGDEVITSPFTFFATTGSISRLGARPVFVDIRPDTFNIDERKIGEKITPRTKAIIPVHLYGQAAQMEPIMKISDGAGIPVVEDAAQAIGAKQKGKMAGTFGSFGCFSFFPSKNLGGFGDGGLVTAQLSPLEEKIRSLRVHGSLRRYYHDEIGCNSRLDALQAAVLEIKLKYLDDWTSGRQKNAGIYDRELAGASLDGKVIVPARLSDNFHVYNQYVIRAKKRDELKNFLTEAGIGTEIYYPLSLHLQKCYEDLGHKKGDFPESEKASLETLALPVYPELAETQVAYVIENIKKFYALSG
ncbi:MAG TPA: DegT/DnrJ/EryC1/StrS family aminotransferase [Nitrospiria bacterium]|nr:DegT/DnrJ/EryC1/StrS family aminotransferase [Nitrospiria bacterium]